MMKYNYTISKLDEVNLKKYKIILKQYREKINSMLDIMLNLDELKTSRIFKSDIKRISFDISFCLNETIKNINFEYRNKNKPTDVITFSLFYDDCNSIIYRKKADLGQIIISVEKANEQKKESLEKEILTLICHGILHLIGFDHLTKKDYDFVVRMQDVILGEL